MKPRQSQRHKQQNNKLVLLTLLAVICTLLLYIFFAPGKGLHQQKQLKNDIINLAEKNNLLSKKNIQLQKDIKKLENDPEYIEEVARKKHGLLKKNEIIFEFNSGKEEK